MKDFQFQQFSISQDQDVFRVGTDAVLLGALANCNDAKSVLEVGTGTGIISLMVAQRNQYCQIKAIDINKDAVNLSQTNFSNSVFSDRITSQFNDFKTFSSDAKFDLVISNPPYFEVNDSQKDVLARQKIELDFNDLIGKSSSLLSPKGILSVIIPAADRLMFQEIAKSYSLFLEREVSIFGIENGPIKRVILEFSLEEKEPKLESLVIEKSPRQYSDDYLELTKDFHIFKKKSN